MKYIDVKYLRLMSPQLGLFTDKGNDLFNFRCPICGDSERDKTKARGYAFPIDNSILYKCHNCGASCKIGNLLKQVDPRLADEYRVEMFEAKFGRREQSTPEKMVSAPPVFLARSPDKVLLALPGVKRLNDLPKDHPARLYMDGRKIDDLKGLFYCEREKVLEKLSTAYIGRIGGRASRILIPFTDRTGNIVGLTGRALGSSSSLRYLTMKLGDDPLIYGLHEWDSRKHTYICEGQFDARFLPNAMAVGGSDLKKVTEIVDKPNTVFVFDNEPRNRDVVSKMRGLISQGFKVCIWPSAIEQKDINDMVLAGAKPSSVQKVIDRNTFSGLSAELAINDWSK